MTIPLFIGLTVFFAIVAVVTALAVIGALAWRDERAKRRRTAKMQVKRHGGGK